MSPTRWPKVLALSLSLVALGFLWAWTGRPGEVRPTPWVLREAWPPREAPYVVLFTDPLCPFCQRLEREVKGLEGCIRYVPVLGHAGSMEAWLERLLREGWEEERARRWLLEGHREARASGVRLTPTALAVGADGGMRTVVGYSSPERWKKGVKDGLGHGHSPYLECAGP